jgi:hypothetical protein
MLLQPRYMTASPLIRPGCRRLDDCRGRWGGGRARRSGDTFSSCKFWRSVGGVPRPSILPHTARQPGATYIHVNILTHLVSAVLSAHIIQIQFHGLGYSHWSILSPGKKPSEGKLQPSLRRGAIYLVFILFSNQCHVCWQLTLYK